MAENKQITYMYDWSINMAKNVFDMFILMEDKYSAIYILYVKYKSLMNNSYRQNNRNDFYCLNLLTSTCAWNIKDEIGNIN